MAKTSSKTGKSSKARKSLKARKTSKPPWRKSNPRKKASKASKHLSPAKKKSAKARAKRAGRPYPNLIDNMAVASKKKSAKKKSAKKSTKKKSTAKKAKQSGKKGPKRKRASKESAEKDPRGGLTAAGRRAFAKKDGAHLKPGVRKSERDMTPSEMRRKGSWAVRFYGREKLPPLVDQNGKPTRHALSACAWGEPVPKSVAAARKIAKKGERLLARYRKLK